MEIPMRSVGEACALTGEPFAPGDRVWSLLRRTEDGGLERLDVFERERERLERDGSVICQWGHRIREPETSEAEERKAALQTAEELFLSLYEEPDGEQTQEEDPGVHEARERMKFFLALQLERRRVLRPLGRGLYRHVSLKREFSVPQLELTPDLVLSHLSRDLNLEAGMPAEALNEQAEPAEKDQ